jgi:hypothetical protein
MIQLRTIQGIVINVNSETGHILNLVKLGMKGYRIISAFWTRPNGKHELVTWKTFLNMNAELGFLCAGNGTPYYGIQVLNEEGEVYSLLQPKWGIVSITNSKKGANPCC